jgi:hypothetical protein
MNQTQKSLLARYNRILRALDKEARSDRCKGDIFVGWDWPTLAIVKPEIYAELKQIEKDFNEETNSLKQGGLHKSQIGYRRKICPHLSTKLMEEFSEIYRKLS